MDQLLGSFLVSCYRLEFQDGAAFSILNFSIKDLLPRHGRALYIFLRQSFQIVQTFKLIGQNIDT